MKGSKEDIAINGLNVKEDKEIRDLVATVLLGTEAMAITATEMIVSNRLIILHNTKNVLRA